MILILILTFPSNFKRRSSFVEMGDLVFVKMSKGRPSKLPTMACRCAYFTYVYVIQMYCKTSM